MTESTPNIIKIQQHPFDFSPLAAGSFGLVKTIFCCYLGSSLLIDACESCDFCLPTGSLTSGS